MNIEPIFVEGIKAFNDNYIWAIRSSNNNNLALVDPGDANVCISYLKQQDLVLTNILVTHHHNDHVGGIAALLDYAAQMQWPITVYGPANENIAYIDNKLSEHDNVHLTKLNCELSVLDVPGHTKGHIAYVGACSNKLTSEKHPMLFCGDALFSGGCGRLFEGSAEQMHHSLSKLSQLPDDTRVYCAHEYTQANLDFATTVEPSNMNLQQYQAQVKVLRLQNKSTIPSSIGLEKSINPFLRCHEKSIMLAADNYNNSGAITGTNAKTSVSTASATEVFSTIRRWKDQF